MELREFHNALRILHGIDEHELPGLDKAKARQFIVHPVATFLQMSDDDAAEVWEAIKRRQPKKRRQMLDAGICEYCDRERGKGQSFPPHDPSPRCQSGGHVHCTCDTCF